jgi:hypothetical protein
MDKRRRAGVIAASGGAISASTMGATVNHHGSFAGLSGDFWIGAIIGLTLVIVVVAAVLVARSRGDCGCL